MPTAWELLRQEKKSIENAMIEFAKLHVAEALKQASEEATADWAGVDPNSILNAYPLENIK